MDTCVWTHNLILYLIFAGKIHSGARVLLSCVRLLLRKRTEDTWTLLSCSQNQKQQWESTQQGVVACGAPKFSRFSTHSNMKPQQTAAFILKSSLLENAQPRQVLSPNCAPSKGDLFFFFLENEKKQFSLRNSWKKTELLIKQHH